MTFSASSLRPTSSPSYSQLLCSLRYNRKLRSQINFVVTQGRKGRWLRNGVSVKSVLNDNRPSFNNYGAPESARLLERLFEQTQKLDNRMIGEEPDLRDFESDLLSALMELKEKEDHLQEVERTVLLENGKLKDAKEELERQESEIKAAREKYERLEDEMKEATASLVSQAGQIEEMKLRLRDRDSEIDGLRDALSLKEEEMEKMKIGLAKKSEEAAYVDSELRQKVQLLSEANEIVKKQEIELLELRSVVRQREEELRLSVAARDVEGEKLKVAEASLEKHTMEWLLTQEELKRLEEEASRHAQESSETLENFRRVKKLLSDVRSELVSSQQSLASSRYKMQVQEGLLEQQLAELADQRESVMLYMENLKDAQIEVENERTKLRVAEALNKELEQDLSIEKELMKKLQEELKKERASLEQAVQEMASLQEELDIKSAEFKEKSALLDVKESELVDAKLQIQELKTEKASLQSLLEEKDLELSSARKMLVELNQEISDLKMLMNDKETRLIEATNMLREKDEHVKVIQNKLNNTSLKAFEAETVVERVLDLTNKLVASIKNEDINSSRTLNELGDQLMMPLSEDPTSELSWQQKRLENVLELTKENLKTKEMEVLAAQRALTIKDEELKMTLARLDAKEEELRKAKDMTTEDANDHKTVYAMTQERIGAKISIPIFFFFLQNLEFLKMRRRPGIGGLQTAAAARDQYKKLGENVAKIRTDMMKEQLSTFRSQLEDFARKHKNDIRKNPAFRSQFHEMCAKVGVDPLASNKGFWAELLGIGDFYYELGVQIVDICLATRPLNGGLINLQELCQLLRQRRKSDRGVVSEDDCLRAISKLKVLGSGFEVISVGKKKLVRSVPTELNKDHNEILELAQGQGFVTVDEVERRLSWTSGRAIDALDTLLDEGLAMIDDGHKDGKRRYWFPCVSPISSLTGIDSL